MIHSPGLTVTMLMTPLSEYNDSIAKMTQFYNNNVNANSQMKADKSRHQLLPLVGENVLDYLMVSIIDQGDLQE